MKFEKRKIEGAFGDANIRTNVCPCGQRGRWVGKDDKNPQANKNVNDGTYCYDCYTKAAEKHFHVAKRTATLTPAQQAYVRLMGDRQRALFYGDEFNDVWLAQAWGNMSEPERYAL